MQAPAKPVQAVARDLPRLAARCSPTPAFTGRRPPPRNIASDWDYDDDGHHGVLGVDLVTDTGPACVTWTDTFFS
jgi:hypothetical protein